MLLPSTTACFCPPPPSSLVLSILFVCSPKSFRASPCGHVPAVVSCPTLQYFVNYMPGQDPNHCWIDLDKQGTELGDLEASDVCFLRRSRRRKPVVLLACHLLRDLAWLLVHPLLKASPWLPSIASSYVALTNCLCPPHYSSTERATAGDCLLALGWRRGAWIFPGRPGDLQDPVLPGAHGKLA